ncbi:MAG TPA: hypothetical protein VJ456_11350 [Acidimicrobiia bacterium]|nr:hypothetical protein [Acidimicrobiia bacterium]
MSLTLVTAAPRGERRAPVLGDDAPWRSADLLRAAALAGAGLAGLALTWSGAAGRADWVDELPWACAGVAATTVAVLGLVSWLVAGLRRVRRLRCDVLPLVQAAAAVRPAVRPAAAAPLADGGFVTAPGMTRFHRPACPLAAGKPVRPLRPGEAGGAGLVPCGVCAA